MAPSHRFLRFEQENYRSRYHSLRRLQFCEIRTIHWGSVEAAGHGDRLAELLPPDSPWRRFFDITEPSYDELVLEFWSTFEYPMARGKLGRTVNFRLCGVFHRLPLSHFATALGVFTHEEVRTSFYLRSLTSLL
jgi:hypothetical protein